MGVRYGRECVLDARVWREIEVDQVAVGTDYVLVLDLGQSAASTYWADTGGLDAFAVFPLEPNLYHRGMADGVDRLYAECADRGELLQHGLKVSDVGELLEKTLFVGVLRLPSCVIGNERPNCDRNWSSCTPAVRWSPGGWAFRTAARV